MALYNHYSDIVYLLFRRNPCNFPMALGFWGDFPPRKWSRNLDPSWLKYFMHIWPTKCQPIANNLANTKDRQGKNSDEMVNKGGTCK